ncbi:MAG: hypothetical protein AAGG51_10060 [Cyanobacteria bacterium P01_G01_bin.54]
MSSSMLSTMMTPREQAVWQSLKLAIAESSGFQRWQDNQSAESALQLNETELDQQVRRYLRETLATLAY